ncbi:hypothetical protein E2C01_069599 [Portunus trituberculatus]|uniref:Uncharacterized protein n=1 Tax=Portunus trituberculatus TaxID=210409 RepID=A0A5B7HZB6_PORTR|nr:hypothetical protein [Portunus trituberculatus]
MSTPSTASNSNTNRSTKQNRSTHFSNTCEHVHSAVMAERAQNQQGNSKQHLQNVNPETLITQMNDEGTDKMVYLKEI